MLPGFQLTTDTRRQRPHANFGPEEGQVSFRAVIRPLWRRPGGRSARCRQLWLWPARGVSAGAGGPVARLVQSLFLSRCGPTVLIVRQRSNRAVADRRTGPWEQDDIDLVAPRLVEFGKEHEGSLGSWPANLIGLRMGRSLLHDLSPEGTLSCSGYPRSYGRLRRAVRLGEGGVGDATLERFEPSAET